MQNELLNTAATIAADTAATTEAVAPVAAPKAKRAGKAKPAATIDTTGLSPRAAANTLHDAHNFTGQSYAGLSKPRNAGQTAPANLGTSKATKRDYAALTERMHKTIAELARGYGRESFPLIGIDRGQLAIFINSGFVRADAENKRGKLHFAALPKANAAGKIPAFYHVPESLAPKAKA